MGISTEPRANILLIDDDLDLRASYRRALDKAGYHVWEAGNGAEGLEMARAYCPDIILLDLRLPDIDGREVCRRIKSDVALADIYIVIISGLKSSSDQLAALEAGADGYLTRPISMPLLIAHLNALNRMHLAERALRRERDFLRQVMENSPVAITMVDREGHIILANTQAEAILGLERAELEGRLYNAPDWKITDYDGGTYPDEKLPFSQVMRAGEAVYGVRHAIQWPNGRRVLLHINGVPLFDDQGQVDRVVFSLLDVTREVRTEQALRASEQKFRALFDYAGDAIFIHSASGVILEVNQYAQEQLGYGYEELLESSLSDILSGEQTQQTTALLERLTSAGNLIFETELQCADGSILPVEVSSRLFPYDGETAVLSIARDIRERKEAEVARARELRTLEDLSGPPMRGVTAASYGQLSLHRANPEFFARFVTRYQELMELALEQRIYRVEHNVSGQLKALGEQLGLVRAAPRDVVEIHVTALKQKLAASPSSENQVIANEGRLLVLELMGYLTAFYRARSTGRLNFGNPSPSPEPGGKDVQVSKNS